MRRSGELRQVYLDYLHLVQRIPLLIDRGIRDGAEDTVTREVEDELARIQATLRLLGSDEVRDYVVTHVPEALKEWHEKWEKISAQDLAKPSEARVGYKETLSQAFKEKLSPVLDELADKMRNEVV